MTTASGTLRKVTSSSYVDVAIFLVLRSSKQTLWKICRWRNQYWKGWTYGPDLRKDFAVASLQPVKMSITEKVFPRSPAGTNHSLTWPATVTSIQVCDCLISNVMLLSSGDQLPSEFYCWMNHNLSAYQNVNIKVMWLPLETLIQSIVIILYTRYVNVPSDTTNSQITIFFGYWDTGISIWILLHDNETCLKSKWWILTYHAIT